jgi:hypothetical protein
MNDIDRLIIRLANKRKQLAPDSLELRTALTRIGSTLEEQMKKNVGRYKMIDSGNLLKKIGYELNKSSVTIGPFGVPYAARNEFGGPMSRNEVIDMLNELRKQKGNQTAKLNKVKGKGKGVVTINPDLTGFWKPRPFIRDALKQHKGFIIDTLRALARDQ